TAIYLLLNLAYLKALGLSGMRESKAVAADLMRVTWGEAGAWVLAIVVMSASLSTLNATVFTGARTNYALGRDYAIFRALGRWGLLSSSPENALLVPVEAVYGAGAEATVQVLVDGKPQARPVVAGLSNGTFTEILEGLEEGTTVITGSLQVDNNPFGSGHQPGNRPESGGGG
ncbi:MAG: hypothetical protein K6U03_09970, partial [Firmicutes bacterium]|nr:hypothetical protein [Bacillota bacterium]